MEKTFIILFPQIPSPQNLLFRIYHLLMTYPQNTKLRKRSFYTVKKKLKRLTWKQQILYQITLFIQKP